MGIEMWKKGLLVVLFFSLALNFGFAFTAIRWKFMPRFVPPPMGPVPFGPGPVAPRQVEHIIDRMDIPQAVREEVKKKFREMAVDHHNFIGQLFEEERKLLTLIGAPGDLDMETMQPMLESFSRVREQSVLNKARHLIEIRKLIGREKSLYLISEIKKVFMKRDPRDKPID